MRNQFLLLLLIGSSVFSQNKKPINSKDFTFKDVNVTNIIIGELDSLQLQELKEYLKSMFNEDLENIGYITISYLQPQKDCWYDNYININSNKSNRIESLENQMNHKLILSHFDKKKSNFRIWDEKKIIYNIFPKANNACDYMVTINKNGVYLYKPGHFSVEIANAFYNELKIYE